MDEQTDERLLRASDKVGQRLEGGVSSSLPTAVGGYERGHWGGPSSTDVLASVWRIGNCQN
jgi:hypothetical protein